MTLTHTEVLKQIESETTTIPVLLYLKGTKLMPVCGFSAQVVKMLNHLNVEYETRNILEDETLRQAIKEYSNWPTIPQLYINGTFIGGCDIITQMFQSGELKKELDKLQNSDDT